MHDDDFDDFAGSTLVVQPGQVPEPPRVRLSRHDGDDDEDEPATSLRAPSGLGTTGATPLALQKPAPKPVEPARPQASKPAPAKLVTRGAQISPASLVTRPTARLSPAAPGAPLAPSPAPPRASPAPPPVASRAPSAPEPLRQPSTPPPARSSSVPGRISPGRISAPPPPLPRTPSAPPVREPSSPTIVNAPSYAPPAPGHTAFATPPTYDPPEPDVDDDAPGTFIMQALPPGAQHPSPGLPVHAVSAPAPAPAAQRPNFDTAHLPTDLAVALGPPRTTPPPPMAAPVAAALLQGALADDPSSSDYGAAFPRPAPLPAGMHAPPPTHGGPGAPQRGFTNEPSWSGGPSTDGGRESGAPRRTSRAVAATLGVLGGLTLLGLLGAVAAWVGSPSDGAASASATSAPVAAAPSTPPTSGPTTAPAATSAPTTAPAETAAPADVPPDDGPAPPAGTPEADARAALEALRKGITTCVEDTIKVLPGSSPAVPDGFAWLKNGPYQSLRNDWTAPFFHCTAFKIDQPMTFVIQYQSEKPTRLGTGIAWVDDDKDGKADRAWAFRAELVEKGKAKLGPIEPIDPARPLQRVR